MNWSDFIQSEAISRDTIDLKKIYIDMADDLPAGVMLSQIVYYYLPSRDGGSKLRVFHEGHYWIAKKREDWWQECRLRTKRADRCLHILEKHKLIFTKNFKFNGAPTVHLRLNEAQFLFAYDAAYHTIYGSGENGNSQIGNNGYSRNGKMNPPKSGISLTESTTQTTTESTGARSAPDISWDDLQSATQSETPLPSESEKKRAPRVKRARMEKEHAPVPAAVEVFKSVRRFYPVRETWDEIGARVGEDEAALARWKQALVEWALKGYNPRNVAGALDWFAAGGANGARAGNGHGHAAVASQWKKELGGMREL